MDVRHAKALQNASLETPTDLGSDAVRDIAAALNVLLAWMISRPSFEKCLTLENATERHACYDNVRAELLKPPAKGAEAPAAALRSPR
jgi:hypothetical protein